MTLPATSPLNPQENLSWGWFFVCFVNFAPLQSESPTDPREFPSSTCSAVALRPRRVQELANPAFGEPLQSHLESALQFLGEHSPVG